jgi:hypothetical protein
LGIEFSPPIAKNGWRIELDLSGGEVHLDQRGRLVILEKRVHDPRRRSIHHTCGIDAKRTPARPTEILDG